MGGPFERPGSGKYGSPVTQDAEQNGQQRWLHVSLHYMKHLRRKKKEPQGSGRNNNWFN
jgi:hypothetical protein